MTLPTNQHAPEIRTFTFGRAKMSARHRHLRRLRDPLRDYDGRPR